MLATLPQVPFHPDEATHLYLSRDFDQLFWQLHPASVTWSSQDAPIEVTHFRLLEAPLSRYLIGLSRTLTGQRDKGLFVDWDWSTTWEANATAGALPDPGLLLAARLPATVATSVGALLMFAIGRRLGGRWAGLSAAVLYGANGELWLHGRRAMSEGPIVFALLLAVWVMLRWGHHAVAIGAAVGLAAAAKLTGVALLPAALLAAWLPVRGHTWRAQISALSFVVFSFLLASLLLNPALWAPRLDTLSRVLGERAALLNAQTSALRTANGPVLDGPLAQTAALFYQLYLAPLQFWEVPNYAAQTAAAEAAYQQLPWQILLHTSSLTANIVPGALLLLVTGVGLLWGLQHVVRPDPTPQRPGERRGLAVVALATVGVTATLFAIPIAWQRYYVPLLPLMCLWAGLGLAALARPMAQRWSARGTHP